MEDSISILDTLNELEKIKNSHPTIYKLWKSSLDIKIISLQNSIKQCNNIIKYVMDNDLSDEELTPKLLLLFLYINNINTNE